MILSNKNAEESRGINSGKLSVAFNTKPALKKSTGAN
jgi:hypothetical protein